MTRCFTYLLFAIAVLHCVASALCTSCLAVVVAVAVVSYQLFHCYWWLMECCSCVA